MAVASGVEEQLRGQGMDVVTEEQGVQALELALKGEGAVVGAVPLEWSVLLGLMEGAVPSFLAAFATKATPQLSQPGQTQPDAELQLPGFLAGFAEQGGEIVHMHYDVAPLCAQRHSQVCLCTCAMCLCRCVD